jgi:hypothetical protein
MKRATTPEITSTITARLLHGWSGPVFRFDITHADGTADSDLSQNKAIDALNARFGPRVSYDHLLGALQPAKQEAQKRTRDVLGQARADALHNQLTTGKSRLPRQQGA